MDFQDVSTAWVAEMFDPTSPYFYAIILPTLIAFALGLRKQALMFAVGAVAFLVFKGII